MENSSVTKQTTDALMIPKHRFDCVNLCLKETKQALKEQTLALENHAARIKQLESELLESKVETALAAARAKDLTAAKALIIFSDLKPEQDGTVSGLEEQILNIKNSRSYLFEIQENVNYILVPVKSGDTLNKSINNYINKIRRADK